MANKSEVDALGHHIAYEAACSIIESHCWPEDDDDGIWFETDPVTLGNSALGELPEAEIRQCVEYLELRGLIERHAQHRSRIQLRDESEPLDINALEAQRAQPVAVIH